MKKPQHLLMAIGIGVVTGTLSVAFNALLNVFVQVVNGIHNTWPLTLVLFPFLAALLTTILYRFLLEDGGIGFGVAQVLVEIKFLRVQVLKPAGVLWRVLASLVTLGLGLTAGRFGPIVHMGAAMGSELGYRLKLEANDLRLAIGCGVVGAIATVFGMPLFAVIFTLEVIFRESVFTHLAPLALAAWCATMVGRFFGLSEPLLGFWSLEMGGTDSPQVFFLLVAIGLLTGLLGTLYVLSIEGFGTLLHRLPHRWIRLLLASFIVGLSTMILPLQLDLHQQSFQQFMLGRVSLTYSVLFIVLHTLTTGLTLGSGFIGGNFFPGLSIGTAAGTLLYKIGLAFTSENGFLALPYCGLLGATGMLSGYLNAPIASIALALEVSGNYAILMPALLVAGISRTLVQNILHRDIFTKTVARISTEVMQQLPKTL